MLQSQTGRAQAARGFTLIEIMLVCALMAIICATAVPNIYQLTKKEGLRRAVSDLKDVCANARAQSIFSGREVSVVFYPPERRFGISGGAPAPVDPATGEAKPAPETMPGTGTTGIIPEDVTLELLEVNLDNAFASGGEWTYNWVRVRFYPNGTSDEMTIVFRSEKGELRKITLEPTTGLLIQGKME